MDTFGLYLSGNKVTDKPEILFAMYGYQGSYGKSRGNVMQQQQKLQNLQKRQLRMMALT